MHSAVSDVSRGTPADPVERLFGERADSARRFVDILTNAGVERGLIGPREVPRLWERHVFNCAVIAPLFVPDATVCDLGSGAGLPGIVVALARPDLRVTLLEPLLRRSTFLTETVEALGLVGVDVVRGRAEDLAGERCFDYVTARAVAPLDRLARWALPLCRPGGELVALKGASAGDEVAAARATLRRLKVVDVRIEQYGADVVPQPTTVVRIQSSGDGKGER